MLDGELEEAIRLKIEKCLALEVQNKAMALYMSARVEECSR
jgi:hypothetical protein